MRLTREVPLQDNQVVVVVDGRGVSGLKVGTPADPCLFGWS